jgi:predicted HicB family RNase H-like nuclease
MSDNEQINVRIRAEAKRKLKIYAAANNIDLKTLVAEGLQMVCDKRGIKTIVKAY